MNKRAFIIHGWDGYPDEGWFPWLKTDLEKNGFQVHIPAMPESAEPKIEACVSHLSKVVGEKILASREGTAEKGYGGKEFLPARAPTYTPKN